MHSDGEYELVVPFTICKSHGGPHDDDAFVSGYRLGQLDCELSALVRKQRPTRWPFTIRHDEVEQFDLIAMRHGFFVQSSEHDETGEWRTQWVSAE